MSVVNGAVSQFRAGRNGFFGDNKQVSSALAGGTYGSATQVAQITVDGAGDITGISNVNIAASGSKVLVSFPVSSATIGGAGNPVLYTGAGSGAVTQALGVFTITNSTSSAQLWCLNFSIYGNPPATEEVGFFLTDTTGATVYAAADAQVVAAGGFNATYRIVAFLSVAANTSTTAKVICELANGTHSFTVTAAMPVTGVSMNNSMQIAQIY